MVLMSPPEPVRFMEREDDLIGIVLPFLPSQIERVLNGSKHVILKFITQVPKKPHLFRLKKGMKVVFYFRASDRKLGGEATIVSLEFLLPQATASRYKGDRFISKHELQEYVSSRPGRTSKPLLVLRLSQPKRYPAGTTYPRNVTMAGEYLTEPFYRSSASAQVPWSFANFG